MFSKMQLELIIVLIQLCIGQMVNYRPCYFKSQCRCWIKIKYYVDCSWSNITNIPSFPSNVSFLSLQHNRIGTIPPEVFKHLTILEELDLSYNRLTKLHLRTFVGLGNLRTLILEHNELNYTKQSFPIGIFKPLQALTHLNVKYIYKYIMENFPDDVISDLKILERLECDAFDLYRPKGFGKGFSTLTRLSTLITGACVMFTVNSITFSNLPHLQYIDVNGCIIDKYDYCTLCNRSSLRYVDFSNIFLETLNTNILLNDLKSTKVEILHLTNTSHYVSAEPLSFIVNLQCTPIAEIYLEKNKYAELQDAFGLETPRTLRILDLSDNKLAFCQLRLHYLSNLNLQNNSLGQFLSRNKYMVSQTTQLKEINLSFNALYHLIPSIFNKHPNLELINVSNNILSDVTFELEQLGNLRRLDLSNNKIKVLNQSVMDSFDKIGLKSNLTIDLSNNMLDCNCFTVTFLNWMIESEIHFEASRTYKCMFDNGTVVVLDSINNQVMGLQQYCKSYTILIVSVSVAICACIIIVCGGIIYRYRWKLRYMYYMTKSRYYSYKPVHSKNVYKNNAFVSYSDCDRDFVLRECIPKLEEEGRLKLCIHHRDFLPGEDITVNITNAIHESKKTVCIITREFLASYYCIFEFNMARMESIYSRQGENTLFLIFHEQILPRELPLVMLELVQEQSYIEYPNDEQGNVVFWEKIKEALE